MANETKSSPADHYFEPNGSNANAENIGHVLNDLTDIVASGTPEEGADAVKWDGENFILGEGGGGIDADENQIVVGDGEGNGIGAAPSNNSKLFSKGGALVIKNTNVDDVTSIPFQLKSVYNEQVLDDDGEPTGETTERENYVFNIDGTSMGIIGEDSQLILHDKSRLHLTAGAGESRKNDGPQVYLHGSPLFAMDDEWYDTGTGRYRPVYYKKYVEVIHKVYYSGRRSDEEIRQDIKSYLDEIDMDEIWNEGKQISCNKMAAYINYYDMLHSNGDTGVVNSENLQNFFEEPGDTYIQVLITAIAHKNKDPEIEGEYYNEYIFHIIDGAQAYIAKENIKMPGNWRLNKSLSTITPYPVATIHGSCVFNMGERSMFNMSGFGDFNMHDSSQVHLDNRAIFDMHGNSHICINKGKIFFNESSVADTPEILMNTGRIAFNSGGKFNNDYPQILMNCGRIEFNPDYSLEEDAPQIILNCGRIEFNPEQGKAPEIVMNGYSKINTGGAFNGSEYKYAEVFLWGGNIQTTAKWSDQDTYNGEVNPGNCPSSVDLPTVLLQGRPKVHISGGSTMLMHQGAEIGIFGRGKLGMDDHSTIDMTGGSKLIMNNNGTTASLDDSPVIMMSPNQYTIASIGANEYGNVTNSAKTPIEDPFTYFRFPALRFSNGSRIFMEVEDGGQAFIRIGDDSLGYVKHTNVLGYICGQTFFKFSDFSHTELTDNSVLIFRGRDKNTSTYPWRDGAQYEKYHNNTIWRKAYDRQWNQQATTTGPDFEVYDESVIRLRGVIDIDGSNFIKNYRVGDFTDVKGNSPTSKAATSLWEDTTEGKKISYENLDEQSKEYLCRTVIEYYKNLNETEKTQYKQTGEYKLLTEITYDSEGGTYNAPADFTIYCKLNSGEQKCYVLLKEERSDWKPYATKREDSPMVEIIENAEIRQHGNTKFILVENNTTIGEEEYLEGLTIKIGNESAHFTMAKLKELAE